MHLDIHYSSLTLLWKESSPFVPAKSCNFQNMPTEGVRNVLIYIMGNLCATLEEYWKKE